MGFEAWKAKKQHKYVFNLFERYKYWINLISCCSSIFIGFSYLLVIHINVLTKLSAAHVVSFQKWKILHLLWWAVPRHHFQHNDETENTILYSEPDHPLYGYLFPHRTCVLPALRQWGKGKKKKGFCWCSRENLLLIFTLIVPESLGLPFRS